MGAQKSRLAKAGGNAQLAAQQLDAEFRAGAPGWSAAQKAAYSNPATRDAFVARQISQSTKGKFSGPFGKIAKVVTDVAPYAAPFIPGVGPLAAAAISGGAGLASGKGLKRSLTQAALSGAGSALLGGQGIGGLKSLPGKISSVARSATSAAPAVEGAAGKSTLRKITDFLTEDPLRTAQLGLGAVNAVQGARSAGQAEDLRRAALSRITQPGPVDLSDIFADERNPYSGSRGPNRAKRAAVAALQGGY